MRHLLFMLGALTLAGYLLASTGGYASTPSFEPSRVADLAWLSGTWWSSSFETHYTTPDGGMMLSTSKWMEDGKVGYYEFERIEQRGDSVVLIPYPGGSESAPFTLVPAESSRKKAIFRNTGHDFPTEFSFELVAPDSLVILVAGTRDGKKESFRFDLSRKR